MPGIDVGDIVQTTVNYLHFNQRLMNVMHWVVNDAATVGTVAEETQLIANTIGHATNPDSFIPKLRSILPDTVEITDVRVQVLYPARYAYRFKNVNLKGQRGSSVSANQDVVAVKRTDLAGRGMQGDFFLPGLDPADAVAGILTDAFIVDLNNSLDILKSAIVTTSGGLYLPIILHRTGFTGTQVTSVLVKPEVRVTTRRTVGRGI